MSSFISDNSEFTTLGVANSNEYYAASYTTVIESRTNQFSSNAFDGLATNIATTFAFIGGATKDTAVGLDDLADQFLLQVCNPPGSVYWQLCTLVHLRVAGYSAAAALPSRLKPLLYRHSTPEATESLS